MIPGTLVVLFYPSEEHVANLIRLKQLCQRVIAVDNSHSTDPGLHARITAAGIDLLLNFNRGGVAGAYNRGLERLIEMGADLLFIFDQDSEVPELYFANMLATCRSIGTSSFLVGPRILDVNVNRHLPAHVVSKFGFTPVVFTDTECGLLSCSSIISSGSVMSGEAYRNLGPFREDFVIDHVDTEYSFRAVCQGVPIYINPTLTLKHRLSRRIDHRLFFLRLIQWNMDPLRQYYSARNCIHIVRRYGAKFPVLMLINIITLQQIISIAVFETDKRRKFLAMFAGIFDGLLNRYGPFEMRHPRISHFCVRQSGVKQTIRSVTTNIPDSC